MKRNVLELGKQIEIEVYKSLLCVYVCVCARAFQNYHLGLGLKPLGVSLTANQSL